MNTSPKDILFWSPQCPHSRNLLNKIKNSPLMDRIVLFNVHDNTYKLPPFVKAVPTLFLKMQRNVLVNEQLHQWVDQQVQFMINQQRQQNINQSNNTGGSFPAPASDQINQSGLLSNPNSQPYQPNRQSGSYKKQVAGNNDDLTGKTNGPSQISEYNPGEMSSGFSDNFAFINNDKAVASHNFTFVGDADDTPPITGIKMDQSDMGDFPTQNNNNNSTGYNSGGNLSYNPDEFNTSNGNMGNMNNMNNMDMGNMDNRGNSMSYNPDPFAGGNNNNGYGNSNSPRDNYRTKELDKKYEELMADREKNDAFAGLY